MRLLLILTALFALAACRTQPAREPVLITARDGWLQIDNRSGRELFFAAMEGELASRARIAPCVSGPDCDSCPANGVVRIRYTELPGYASGAREAVVFWWFAVNGTDGRSTAETIRSVVVPL